MAITQLRFDYQTWVTYLCDVQDAASNARNSIHLVQQKVKRTDILYWKLQSKPKVELGKLHMLDLSDSWRF